ncbi:MAG: 5-formyltetrahydrofolate cyclo-ligase [Clostridia bacterium]
MVGQMPDGEEPVGGTDKQSLRRRMKRRRAELSAADRVSRERRVANVLAVWPSYRDARMIAFFASFGTEIDTWRLIRSARGDEKQIYLPRVAGPSLELCPVYWSGITPMNLVGGYRGIREPDSHAEDPRAMDVIVVPGLAFDGRGYRVGYGGGYYDRLLSSLGSATTTVGLCYRFQMVDDLPTEAHDKPVDYVVTEDGLHVAGGPS